MVLGHEKEGGSKFEYRYTFYKMTLNKRMVKKICIYILSTYKYLEGGKISLFLGGVGEGVSLEKKKMGIVVLKSNVLNRFG